MKYLLPAAPVKQKGCSSVFGEHTCVHDPRSPGRLRQFNYELPARFTEADGCRARACSRPLRLLGRRACLLLALMPRRLQGLRRSGQRRPREVQSARLPSASPTAPQNTWAFRFARRRADFGHRCCCCRRVTSLVNVAAACAEEQPRGEGGKKMEKGRRH